MIINYTRFLDSFILLKKTIISSALTSILNTIRAIGLMIISL